jgi:hypothetical protein
MKGRPALAALFILAASVDAEALDRTIPTETGRVGIRVVARGL